MMLRWIRWMLVDSSGSRNPLARPDRDAVLVPGSCGAGPVGSVMTRGSVERLAFDVGEQRAASPRRPSMIAAAVHDAVADAVLQRNAPLPAGLVRDRARVRHRRRRSTRSARRRRCRRAASATSPRSRFAAPVRSAGRGSRCSR